MSRKRDRTLAFSQESPRDKSLLWRQHLAYYETKLDLNEKQRNFLTQVSALLDEQFFATPINMSEAEYFKTARGQPFKELMQNVPKLFTQEQTRQLFSVIGDTSTVTEWGCSAAQVPTTDSKRARAKGPNNSEPNSESNSNLIDTCTCTASVCGTRCPAEMSCWVGFPSAICDKSGTECGCFGMFYCDGLCFEDHVN